MKCQVKKNLYKKSFEIKDLDQERNLEKNIKQTFS